MKIQVNKTSGLHWKTKTNQDEKKEKKEIQQRQLDVLMDWVSERISTFSDVPRVDDVVQHAYAILGYRDLKRSHIARRLRLHPAYLMSSSQKRGPMRWKRYRPIIANTLGMLHGDLGYFSVKREYETPVTYRAGFLVLKDVLSRFTYVVILRRNKSAESMVRAFTDILQQHKEIYGPVAHNIKSIAFDQETSVMSRKVQAFLQENNIAFHAFKYTASKSKMAEGAIRLIRTTMARLLQQHPEKRWWQALDNVVSILNSQPIRIHGKALRRSNGESVWRPRDVTVETLSEFRRDLLKADPAQFFGQYNISPRLVNFKFPVGTVVRPTLLVTSSVVVGEKRSEVSLEQDSFVITEHLAYVNARFEIGRAYRCVNRRTQQEEIFDERDLAESV